MSIWQKLFGSKSNSSSQLKSKIDPRLESELWAKRLKEARDWQSLAIIFTIEGGDEGTKHKRIFARKVLKEAGTEAVDAVIVQLNVSGVGLDDLAEILTEIGDERAVKPLLQHIKILSAIGGCAERVVRFFSRIGSKEAAQGLLPYLNDEDVGMRTIAAYGLGLLGLQEMEAPLRAALEKYGSSISSGLKDADTEFSRSIISQWVSKRKAAGPNVERMTYQEMLTILQKLCEAYTTNDRTEIENLEPLATDIGKELNRRGGLEEMVRVFKELNSIRGSRTLEMLWGGIGNWQG